MGGRRECLEVPTGFPSIAILEIQHENLTHLSTTEYILKYLEN